MPPSHETLELLGEAPAACAGNGNQSLQPLASQRASSLGIAASCSPSPSVGGKPCNMLNGSAYAPDIGNGYHRPNVVALSCDDGAPMPTGAERWQALAVETFAAAQTMADPESKQVLLLIAEAYERLAERAQAPK